MSTTLDAFRSDAEAIEHAVVVGLLDGAAGDLPDAQVIAAIAAVARDADREPGGLWALFADDYFRDPPGFCRRMHTALALAEHLNHAAALAAQNGEQYV
jgi:hypothetical protein